MDGVTTAPQTVATAVMMAGFSGLGGTAKEAFSLASSLAHGANSASPLIREISARDEIMTAQGALRSKTSSLDHHNFKQQLNTLAVGRSEAGSRRDRAKVALRCRRLQAMADGDRAKRRQLRKRRQLPRLRRRTGQRGRTPNSLLALSRFRNSSSKRFRLKTLVGIRKAPVWGPFRFKYNAQGGRLGGLLVGY